MKEKVYRIRRGKLVEVPEKWVGHICYKQTMRKRDSHWNSKGTARK